MTVEIRPATEADYAAIGELIVTVYRSVGPVHPDYAASLRRVADRAGATEQLVATGDDGEVIGAVGFVPEPNGQHTIARGNEAEFRTLAVATSAQGQGVGAALVDHCIARARALHRDRLVLTTMPWMHAAHRLYEKRGFRRTPERDWSPRPGFDCLTYSLDL